MKKSSRQEVGDQPDEKLSTPTKKQTKKQELEALKAIPPARPSIGGANTLDTTYAQGSAGFKISTEYKPAGDQPKAIKSLVEGIKKGYRHQTLLGVTGSGKTYTAANVIQEVQKPTLIIAHNKTLAAQLAQEYKEFFPENAVHYFVSYYDYYQPEAYIAHSDTYI